MPDFEYRPDTLEDGLLTASLHNAKRAFNQFRAPAHVDRVDAAVSVGMAVELLLKFLVVTEAPALLAELKPSSAESAWRSRRLLSVRPLRYGPEISSIKSCTAEDVHMMVGEIFAGLDLLPRNAFLTIMQIRNAACHLGALPTSVDFEDAIYALLQLLIALQNQRLIPSDAPWVFEWSASHFMKKHSESRVSLVKKKITLAVAPTRPEAFAPGYESAIVGFFEAESKREMYEAKEPWLSFGYQLCNCPACKNSEAQLLCETEGDVAGSDEQHDPYRTIALYHPLAFGCKRCGLTLSGREIRQLRDAEDQWSRHWSQTITVDEWPAAQPKPSASTIDGAKR